jgi:hypothetical protein
MKSAREELAANVFWECRTSRKSGDEGVEAGTVTSPDATPWDPVAMDPYFLIFKLLR